MSTHPVDRAGHCAGGRFLGRPAYPSVTNRMKKGTPMHMSGRSGFDELSPNVQNRPVKNV